MNKNILNKIKKFINSPFISTVLALTLFLLILFNFIIQIGCVTSGSMEPTLNTGSYVVYNRLAYVSRTPQRGDIVIFVKDNEICSKRVIAVGGDTIKFFRGQVYLNDELLDESTYLASDVKTRSNKIFEVPSNSVFVLGDNRDCSYDSRLWSDPFVPIATVKGKFFCIIPFLKNTKYID